jgi:hypothetical protein
MGEVILSTGKVVTLDLSKVTFGEWRGYFSARQSHSADDAFVEKVTGLKSADQEKLLRDDYRRILQAIIKAGNEPLNDPNSASASTLD